MKGIWIEEWIWIVQKVDASLCIQRICSFMLRVADMSFAVRSWFQPGPNVCAIFASLESVGNRKLRGHVRGECERRLGWMEPCFRDGYFAVVGGFEGEIVVHYIRNDIS